MSLQYIVLALCLLTSVLSKSYKQLDSEKATLEEYIQSAKLEVDPRYKLQYHVTPPVGWMNDPNGFSFYKGEYHLFYQFYPYESLWGPMHWGHVSSPDLVEWTHLPTALIPEDEMCFSGSAVVDGDNLVLMYTARHITDVEPFYNETQYLAYSNNGVDFDKYEGNPILSFTPNSSPDFRDPKVWKYGDHWYVVIGSKTDDENGRVLLYRSLDLKSWDFLTVLGESDGDMGYMWECPDFFELDGKFVLLMSPQGLEPRGDRFKNTYQTGYIIGSFDYDTFEFIPEVEFQEIDFGHDFYASQTMEKDGKRYLIAWFSTWGVPFYPEAADGWAGALTIVRELKLVGNTILMKPVENMIKLREYTIWDGEFEQGQEIDFEKTGEIIINGDWSMNIELLVVGGEGGGQAWIRWDPQVETVAVDRGSGDVRQMEWSPTDSESTWRLFLDASSLELFCGEGEVVFSSRVYPEGNWKLLNLSPHTLSIEAYHLRRGIAE
jgi:beta-fructofuranosidase